MMLTSTFHQLPQQSYYSPYTPPRSSPLSTNATSPRLFDFGTVSQPKTPTPTRVYKANPVMQTRDAATKRRRDMFFRRVQTGREDKKWEARGEQIQQLDFVSERKRWEAEKARQAPPEDDAMVDETPLPGWSGQGPEMMEADYVAAQEEYELKTLIASMEQEDDGASQHFGSDDEDYDTLFMDVGVDHHQSQLASAGFEDAGTMDMEMTDG